MNNEKKQQVTARHAHAATMERAFFRIQSLKAVGVYEMLLIVRPDGYRELVVKNAGQPYKLEQLGEM
jgi:hypothetical protein